MFLYQLTNVIKHTMKHKNFLKTLLIFFLMSLVVDTLIFTYMGQYLSIKDVAFTFIISIFGALIIDNIN